jgi:hypothetical protein
MSHKRNHVQIIAEIQTLLDELSDTLGKGALPAKVNPIKPPVFKGASGGIRLLISEGFFKQPKTLPQVSDRLRQEGFTYTKQVTSVALLRLVRDRTMVRLPAGGEGKETWIYAERK